jgi:hypothetical protein
MNGGTVEDDVSRFADNHSMVTHDVSLSARALASSLEAALEQGGFLSALEVVIRDQAADVRAVLDTDGVLGLYRSVEQFAASINHLPKQSQVTAVAGGYAGVLVGLMTGLLLRHIETPTIH